jgi:hypothetical protein
MDQNFPLYPRKRKNQFLVPLSHHKAEDIANDDLLFGMIMSTEIELPQALQEMTLDED